MSQAIFGFSEHKSIFGVPSLGSGIYPRRQPCERTEMGLVLAGIDRANLRAVLSGRRRPSRAILARLEEAVREP